MEITIKWRIAKQIRKDLASLDEFVSIFGDEDSDRENDKEVDLAKLTRSEVERLRDVLKTSAIQGTKVLAADLTKYLRAADDGVETLEPRNVRQAAWMMEHFIAQLEHHIVFSEDEYEGGSYVGYFVKDVRYSPEIRSDRRNDFKPEQVVMSLAYIDNDVRKSLSYTLDPDEVIGLTPKKILAKQGLIPENATLMATLKRETELLYATREKIGAKYMARGQAKADLDDASKRERTTIIYSSHGSKMVKLDLFGSETPVVVDVRSETGDKDEDRNEDRDINLYRWHKHNLRYFSPSEEELARHLEADEDTEFRPDIQVPVHPLVPVFDLKRHLRCRAHVNNLKPYQYRPELAAKLIIPDRDREMIDMLVDQSNNTFQDIISGKGQSMNILSGGPPGTGKTLTAEVFAEFKSRPLYTVQCSQLGLKPDEIEENLSVILQRANRWNAVLLLDEADVYISRRGQSLTHNAIVGVFLRVLEYASCILFMTTNMASTVDDAIASRCIVAIGYEVPDADAQRRIWRQLADLNKIKLSDATIARFVEEHPKVSGRDVKNLLKLASFMSARSGKPITHDVLEYALQYKPTADIAAMESR